MEAAAVGASAVGALALGPIGLVGGLFIKGKDVEMPAGTELYIQTQQDVETHGMKQAEGAPKAILHKKVKGGTVTADMTEHVEKSALAEDAKAETAAESETEGAGEAAAPGEDEPSVVIIRHE